MKNAIPELTPSVDEISTVSEAILAAYGTIMDLKLNDPELDGIIKETARLSHGARLALAGVVSHLHDPAIKEEKVQEVEADFQIGEHRNKRVVSWNGKLNRFGEPVGWGRILRNLSPCMRGIITESEPLLMRPDRGAVWLQSFRRHEDTATFVGKFDLIPAAMAGHKTDYVISPQLSAGLLKCSYGVETLGVQEQALFFGRLSLGSGIHAIDDAVQVDGRPENGSVFAGNLLADPKAFAHEGRLKTNAFSNKMGIWFDRTGTPILP